MKTEFVTYEQALALKELGFDEPCFGTYRKDACGTNKPFEYDIEYHTKVQLQHGIIPKNSDYINDWVSVPLKQQVFRWFREKHGVVGYVEPTFDSSKRLPYNEHRYQWIIKLEQRVFIKDGDFDSCEEAESACLNKLIDIVKNER